MAATAGPDAGSRFGFNPGQEIQEFGYDTDVDEAVRSAVSDVTGTDLVDEEYSDVVDGAIIWWREDDGDESDLTDLLVDALDNLDDAGTIVVLTPKPGRGGHVGPAVVEDAARTAGLQPTGSVGAGADWNGLRLLARGRGR
ncbi:DUF3052 domain-containing protein [Oceanitalea stevensii]|uniref:DUF3052 domain-containing protein n=1 Tax=Oceanitalea stevensii TaxID=2763072 RepID=UPI002044E3C4|nr:DUF3052 domain-containing protein [Oceanitalea stevensii]